MVEAATPAGTTTEAFAWLPPRWRSAGAIGAAGGGVLVDRAGPTAAFVLAGAAGVFAVLRDAAALAQPRPSTDTGHRRDPRTPACCRSRLCAGAVTGRCDPELAPERFGECVLVAVADLLGDRAQRVVARVTAEPHRPAASHLALRRPVPDIRCCTARDHLRARARECPEHRDRPPEHARRTAGRTRALHAARARARAQAPAGRD